MAFSTDEDVRRLQPYVFEHGVASFDEYHEPATGELVDELVTEWIPAQSAVLADDFDAERLDAAQWMTAAVCRVLGWYVLPRLAASVGGEGLLSMMEHYRREYALEMQRVIRRGVRYDTGSGFEQIDALPVSEVQRLRK
jgi:hypothetical protein